MLQCVAGCCSVLLCVAVCCCVSHSVDIQGSVNAFSVLTVLLMEIQGRCAFRGLFECFDRALLMDISDSFSGYARLFR